MLSTVHVLRYLWAIFPEIPGSWKQRKQILSRVAASVRDFASENPNGGYDDIVARFGTPRQIIAAYVNEMETPEIVEQLRVRKKIVTITSVVALTVILLWAGVVFTALADHNIDVNGQFGEEIVNVINENQGG